MKRLFCELKNEFVTPFGSLLGSYQGVNGYSNGNDHYFSRQQNFSNGLYTGIKYQCVEYARRWLQQSKGLTFYNVPHAADIWKLKYVERISDNKLFPVKAHANGNEVPPVPDSLLIWSSSSDSPFGHVAVITEVDLTKKIVNVAEQNLCNNYWKSNYSRSLSLEVVEGKYWIKDYNSPLGWIELEKAPIEKDHIFKTFSRVTQPLQLNKEFLDLTSPAQVHFGTRNGWKVSSANNDLISFYLFDSHFADRIRLATRELNNMCLFATDTVINSDSLLKKFGLPEWTWERIRGSWAEWANNRLCLTGRFDLAVSGRLIKMIEFNADSAGILIETALIQDKWAKASGSDLGQSAGDQMEESLITQAKKIYKDFVHLMIDTDPEEVTTSLYMKEVLKKAGIDSKLILGLNFTKDSDGKYRDLEGREIKDVWKTWNWETMIGEFESKSERVKVSDVMFSKSVRVFEPLWKVVTSNKALLAVLWEIFPNHPYLLRTEWNLEGYFKNKPYVKKPIVGRCGENIEIFDENWQKVEAKSGNFGNRDNVYQELFKIESHAGYYPIIGSWMIGGNSAGFVIREDTKRITEYNSPAVSCRVLADIEEK